MLTCCVLAFFGVSLLSLTVNSLEMSSSADIGRSEFNIFGLPFVWLNTQSWLCTSAEVGGNIHGSLKQTLWFKGQLILLLECLKRRTEIPERGLSGSR